MEALKKQFAEEQGRKLGSRIDLGSGTLDSGWAYESKSRTLHGTLDQGWVLWMLEIVDLLWMLKSYSRVDTEMWRDKSRLSAMVFVKVNSQRKLQEGI